MLICDCVTPEVRRAAEPVGVGGFKIGYVTDDGFVYITDRFSALAGVGHIVRVVQHDTPVHLTQGAAASELVVGDGWPTYGL